MAFKSNQNPYDNVWTSVTPSSRWRPPYLFFAPAPPWRETQPLFTRGWWRYLQAGSMVMITFWSSPKQFGIFTILLGRHDAMKSHVVSSACRWCPPSIFKISKKVVGVKQGSQMNIYRKIFQRYLLYTLRFKMTSRVNPNPSVQGTPRNRQFSIRYRHKL